MKYLLNMKHTQLQTLQRNKLHSNCESDDTQDIGEHYLLIQSDFYFKIRWYGISMVNELDKYEVNGELLRHVQKLLMK